MSRVVFAPFGINALGEVVNAVAKEVTGQTVCTASNTQRRPAMGIKLPVTGTAYSYGYVIFDADDKDVGLADVVSALNQTCQPEGELAKEVREYAAETRELLISGADIPYSRIEALCLDASRAAARIDELEKACRWIPVSERLPAERHGNHHSEWVVATDGKDWTIAEYNRAHGSWLKDHSPHDLDMGPVTHWKPIILPAALGEKTDENQR
jgi:hypothetical protein